MILFLRFASDITFISVILCENLYTFCSFFNIVVIYWALLFTNHFSFLPSTIWTVCKLVCTFGDPAFIAWMSPFEAGRIQTGSLHSSYLPGEHCTGSFLNLEIFSYEPGSGGSWALNHLTLLCNVTVPCGQDEWGLTNLSPLCLKDRCMADSHFNEQVIGTHGFQLHPQSRVLQ